MLGPFIEQEPKLIQIATALSSAGERVYVFATQEESDPDYPMLDGLTYYYLGHAYRHGFESLGANGTMVKLIGMAMDGEWYNSDQVHDRRSDIEEICRALGPD